MSSRKRKTPLKVLLDKIGNDESVDPIELGENCSIPSGVLSTTNRNHVQNDRRQLSEVLKYLLSNHSPKEVDSILADAFEAMGNTNLAEKFGGQTQNGSVGGGVQETDDLDPSSPIVMIPQPMRASRGRGAEADSDDPDPAKGRNWWKYATIILALLLLVCISFLLVRVQTYSYI